MKILLLNNSDIEGGAARAAFRLHQGLKNLEITSQMLVQVKSSDDRSVIGSQVSSGIGQIFTGLRLTLDHLPLKLYTNRLKTTYSLQWVPDILNSKIQKVNPDIINLHWINNGYLPIESLAKLTKPIIWTLHDMWAFTGGCHYSDDCTRYMDSCGSCPQLQKEQGWDLSRWVWQRKAKAWNNIDLTLVTPSKWLAECAGRSSLFKNLRIEVIPNGLNTKVYKPLDRKFARELLNLPQDKQIVLFGSMQATSDRRKGFHLLQSALRELGQTDWKNKLEVAIFGASLPENPPDFGFKCHYLGTLNDDLSLALVYSAADLLVVPSTQDNLPNTVMEAISCGTPCIGFNIGGLPDMIEHQKNGYLAQPYEIADLARGIVWSLENEERYEKLSYRAREKAEKEFTQEIQAHHYLSLFNEIRTNKNKKS